MAKADMTSAEYRAMIGGGAMPPARPAAPAQARASVATVGRTARALNVFLEIPPSTNNAYANVPAGGRALTLQGRRYKAGAAGAIEAAASAQGFYVMPHERLSLSINLLFPNRKRRDISNCVKLIEDSFAHALGFDDKLIDVLHVERRLSDIPGRSECEVILSVIEHDK